MSDQTPSRMPPAAPPLANLPTTGSDAPFIAWFDEPGLHSGELIGGKCKGLAEMTASGLPVPPGFAITTVAHRRGLEPALLRWLESSQAGRTRTNGAAGSDSTPAGMTALREIAASIPMDASVQSAVSVAYEELGRRAGRESPAVAVRSSAEIEDGDDASFAGQFDTYLWVIGADAVLDAVRRV